MAGSFSAANANLIVCVLGESVLIAFLTALLLLFGYTFVFADVNLLLKSPKSSKVCVSL